MRSREFLTLLESEQTLNPNKLTKDMVRFDRLIANITAGNPLYLKDGTPVVIKNTEAKRLQDLFDQGKFAGTITLLGADQKPYPLGSFLKTKEYGGQSVPPNQQDTDAVPVAGLRPGQVFQHGDPNKDQNLTPELALELGAFLAGQLGQKIQSNKHLDSQGAAGAAVKEISRAIDAEQIPTVPDLSKSEIGNIQNYGFEYLGVQALIKGVANFPNSEAFYEHVGGNLEELVLYFPASSSNPVADSYALVNRKTENTIFISSKGAGGGMPSSVTALKIPNNMRKMIGKDPAITFIDMLQQNAKPAWIQPFYAANWLEENYPGSMGELSKFLPFTDELFIYLSTILKSRNEGVPETLDQIPAEFQELYKLVETSITAKHPLWYYLRYYVKDVIHSAVKKGVIPNFSKRMIELLGQNFVLLKTTIKGKQFITDVKWPSKVGGTITFEHKDPAPKWDSAMTWKLN
jgi:hypothetical protein